MNIDKWKEMLAGGSKNVAKVISQMLQVLGEIEDEEYLNQVIRISARQKNLKRSLMNEEITEDNARVAQSKITKAILFTLDEMDDEGILTEESAVSIDKAEELGGIEGLPNAPLTIEGLQKNAKETQQLLFALQDEKEMTTDTRAEGIIERQIEKTEQELNELKAQIRNFVSE